MSCVAIIPARGGSKRIPKKNIKSFLGKPIIQYVIEMAQESALFDDIVVSTDCETTAGIARNCGAKTPFLRPANLADDFTGTQAVVRHALCALGEQKKQYDYVCCLYATSPLLQEKSLIEGLNKLQKSKCDFVISAVPFDFPVQRALIQTGEFYIPQQPDAMVQRSQDLTPAFHDAAQFYWGTQCAFLENQNLWGTKTQAVVLSQADVQDIDTPDDWMMAELKYRLKYSHNNSECAHE